MVPLLIKSELLNLFCFLAAFGNSHGCIQILQWYLYTSGYLAKALWQVAETDHRKEGYSGPWLWSFPRLPCKWLQLAGKEGGRGNNSNGTPYLGANREVMQRLGPLLPIRLKRSGWSRDI